jgi:hypothetical protein
VQEAGGVGGGMVVTVRVKLEVARAGEEDDGGKIGCTVSWWVLFVPFFIPHCTPPSLVPSTV